MKLDIHILWPNTVRRLTNSSPWNRDHLAAGTAANGGLQILASEGYDPSVHLEKELVEHARDMHFNHP